MKQNGSLIFGRNPVFESLNAHRVTKVYLLHDFSDNRILSLIKEQNLNVTYLNRGQLDNMCDGVHQGCACEIKPYQYVSLEEILHKGKDSKDDIIVLLDGINDPQNFGAILRSCDVFGVTGVIIPKHNEVSLNATVAKTSAGAINYVPVCLANNLNNAIKILKERGYWVVATDGSGTYNYQELKYDFKVALIIGSEGKGVSNLVLKNSDYIVKIPQFGHVNSLNASVACGILLARIKNK